MLKFKDFVEFLNEGVKHNTKLDLLVSKFFNSYKGSVKSSPRHLRYNLEDDDPETVIKDALNKSGITDYDIKTVSASDYKNNSCSGEFETHIVTLKSDVKISGITFLDGDSISIVNAKPANGIFGGKVLTPSNIGLPEGLHMTTQKLHDLTSDSLKDKLKDKPAALQALLSLVEEVYNHTPGNHFNQPSDIRPFIEEIRYSEKSESYIEALSSTDINAVGKDFGEILGAIFLSKCVDYKEGIMYPKGNEPLIDFYLDQIKVSSKFKKGAAPTLSGVCKNVDIEVLVKDEQKTVLEVLKLSQNNGVSEGYLRIAEYIDMQGYQILSKIIGKKEVKANDINDHIKSLIIKPNDEYDSDKFFEVYDEFFKSIASWPKGKKVNWDDISNKDGKFYGAVVGPLSQAIPKALNENPDNLNALKDLCSMLPINQLYLDFEFKKNLVKFKLSSFMDPESIFRFEAPNQSVYNPDNGRLGFKME